MLAAQPDRLAAIEGLAKIRARQGRLAEAAALLERAVPLARDPGTRLVEVGLLRMELGETGPAITALEQARDSQGAAFRRHLELGVLYLAAGGSRTPAPRSIASRPTTRRRRWRSSSGPRSACCSASPTAVSAIRAAWERADPATRRLIADERLFVGLLPG